MRHGAEASLLERGAELLHESVIGTEFRARVVGDAEVAGRPAVVTEVEGSASRTGTHEFVIDPRDALGEGFLLRQGAPYLLAAIAGACAYAYIYAFVAAPPRPQRAAVVAASAATMLLWIALTVGFRVFAERWPGYDTNYGVFATLIVGLIWLWLTNVSVLLGGAFAHEWANAASPVPAHADRR